MGVRDWGLGESEVGRRTETGQDTGERKPAGGWALGKDLTGRREVREEDLAQSRGDAEVCCRVGIAR